MPCGRAKRTCNITVNGGMRSAHQATHIIRCVRGATKESSRHRCDSTRSGAVVGDGHEVPPQRAIGDSGSAQRPEPARSGVQLRDRGLHRQGPRLQPACAPRRALHAAEKGVQAHPHKSLHVPGREVPGTPQGSSRHCVPSSTRFEATRPSSGSPAANVETVRSTTGRQPEAADRWSFNHLRARLVKSGTEASPLRSSAAMDPDESWPT